MSRTGKPGLLGRIRNAWAVATGTGIAIPPWDDYWYSNRGFDSAAGMDVTPETAMRLSAVFACVRVRSETLASLPLIIYKRLPGGGKRRASEHPLYHLLHNAPNIWQSSLEFIEMMNGHLDLRGNAFARILGGPTGPIEQLVPLHPDLVNVYRLPNGRLKYQVRSRFTAEVEWYTQDEIFHLRGLSSDGLVGLSPIAVQRETVGAGLGMQDHAARFFKNSSVPSGILEHPGKFKDDAARKKFRESWQEAQTRGDKHKIAVLEEGMKYTALGLSNKDSQFLEAKQASANEICGIFRVPPHKIGILERSTNNNIEHQEIEFVTSCIRPMGVRWERRINIDLIDPVSEALGAEPGEYFAEFLVDGLLRGDLQSRYTAYSIGRAWGWLSPNDVCGFENLNPIAPGKGGDDYLRPASSVVAGTVQTATPMPGAMPENETPENPAPDKRNQPEPPPPSDLPEESPEDEAARRNERLLRAFATEAAGRIVRKEVTALRKALARSVKNGAFDESGFRNEAQAFYSGHAALVAQTMCISAAAASRYVRSNLKFVCEIQGLEEKSCALDWIEDTAPETLAATALGEKSAKAAKRERCAS